MERQGSISMSDIVFNVAAIKRCTEAEGPFRRMAIWFQGCNICCEGCCNPEFIPIEMRHLMKLEDILEVIRASRDEFGIEGVTLLGGEPTLQQNLCMLTGSVKDMGLGIILFTGCSFEDLPRDLVDSVDLIVDGRFDENAIDEARNMIGSTNQSIISVSSRYSKDLDWFNVPRAKYVEVDVSGSVIRTNGDIF